MHSDLFHIFEPFFLANLMFIYIYANVYEYISSQKTVLVDWKTDFVAVSCIREK